MNSNTKRLSGGQLAALIEIDLFPKQIINGWIQRRMTVLNVDQSKPETRKRNDPCENRTTPAKILSVVILHVVSLAFASLIICLCLETTNRTDDASIIPWNIPIFLLVYGVILIIWTPFAITTISVFFCLEHVGIWRKFLADVNELLRTWPEDLAAFLAASDERRLEVCALNLKAQLLTVERAETQHGKISEEADAARTELRKVNLTAVAVGLTDGDLKKISLNRQPLPVYT